MAGFERDILLCTNVNFDTAGSKPHTGIITNDGQLLIGSSTPPYIRAGNLSSSDSSILFTASPGALSLKVGTMFPSTFTANFGTATPASNNINIVGGTGISTSASGSTVTIVNTATASAGTITGDSGGALSQTASNWNILGSGSITTSGAVSTLTVQLTGLTAHSLLIGAGTSTITKLASGTTGQILQTNTGADPTWSTPTYPSASGTSGKVLISDGTNVVYSTPTYPNASATAGKIIISDGTNFVASTPTYPNTSGTAGKVLVSDGTNNVYSTPTFPNASATLNKVIKSDGTNWIASTETYAAPGTSGNVMTSDGTNWTSAALSSSLPGTINYVTKTLTSAQIKSLHGTPIQVVAAQGSGKVIIPIMYLYKAYNYGGSNAFTAAASQTINLYYGTTQSFMQLLSNATLTGTANSYVVITNTGAVSTTTLSDLDNAALNLYNPIATEISGNAGNNNTFTICLMYFVTTVST